MRIGLGLLMVMTPPSSISNMAPTIQVASMASVAAMVETERDLLKRRVWGCMARPKHSPKTLKNPKKNNSLGLIV